jgi:hypothetical protein
MHEAVYYQQKQQHKFRRRLFSMAHTDAQGTARSDDDDKTLSLIKIHKKFRGALPDQLFKDIKSNSTDEMNQVIEHLKYMSFSTAQGKSS